MNPDPTGTIDADDCSSAEGVLAGQDAASIVDGSVILSAGFAAALCTRTRYPLVNLVFRDGKPITRFGNGKTLMMLLPASNASEEAEKLELPEAASLLQATLERENYR